MISPASTSPGRRMGAPGDGSQPVDLPSFDREMNAKVLKYGSREDRKCPRCGEIGYRRVADSEMVALFACRHCGFQQQQLHEAVPDPSPPFREYREGRGFRAAAEESDAADAHPRDP